MHSLVDLKSNFKRESILELLSLDDNVPLLSWFSLVRPDPGTSVFRGRGSVATARGERERSFEVLVRYDIDLKKQWRLLWPRQQWVFLHRAYVEACRGQSVT